MPAGDQRTNLVQAYSDSLHVIWLLMTVISGVAFISSIFTKEYSLDQEHKTRQGLIAGEERP